MRISDWSSDVCSSDLSHHAGTGDELLGAGHRRHRGLSFGAEEVSRVMTRSASLLAIALASALVLAGCSGSDTPAGHSSSDRAEGHTISSAGLPKGHVDAGEQLAHAKGKDTGQSCVDCHGEEGNAPIDARYPKLGGQYHDYLEIGRAHVRTPVSHAHHICRH